MNISKLQFKKYVPYIGALIIFAIFIVCYSYPVIFEGKELQAGDTQNYLTASNEAKEYYEKTNHCAMWTGSMFSGMPSFQVGYGSPESAKAITPLSKIVAIGLTNNVLFILLCYLTGFFILLKSFKVNTWLSVVGSMAITLSSYFFIIIPAGHVTKAETIGMMAVVIAGFVLIYNKKYLTGAIFTMIYATIGLTKHPQMTYYFFLLIGIFLLAELYIHIRERRMKDFFVAALIFTASCGIGLGTQYSKIKLNQDYMKETMRGGHSELTDPIDSVNKTEGLNLDYATQWSYGIDETMTLLIPNFKGGSSNYSLDKTSNTFYALKKNGVPYKNSVDFIHNVPTYWGTQPFTSGPVYVGAIILFLFVLGLFIVKGPYKWAILIATLFSIILAWGKNFMPLTEFFFKYFPFYNSFRAVSSILVIAEVMIPLLAILSIKTIMDKTVSKEKLIKSINISAGITAGIALFFAIFGKAIYNFSSPNDAQTFAQLPQWLSEAIVADRASMFVSDAFRSAIFIILGALVVWLFVKEKIKPAIMICLMGILIVGDMWAVDKRFFNNDNFVTPKNFKSYFKKQPYEEYILQDKDPNFRVLNLTTNTFNESRTSYYLKSIGGYSAVKLRRYQDIIDRHISKFNMSVLNMLNTKYFITNSGNTPTPQLNRDALGNAWFVDSILVVNTPDEECNALDSINVRKMAVYDAKFKDAVLYKPSTDSSAKISFLSYFPNKLEYKSISSKDGIAVFSEIYYPYGWHALIDDKPVEHFRVNYILRGLSIPAGEHKITFVFNIDSLRQTEPISYICIAIVYLSIIAAIIFAFLKKKKNREQLSKI